MLSIDVQRRIDRFLGPPLCWLLTLLHRLKGPAPPPREIRRILVILLSEMGALVLAGPMFERLRAKYRDSEIYVLAFAQNLPALDLLDVVPPSHMIGLRTGSLPAFAADSMRAVRRIRALRIDVAIDMELFARASAIYSGLSGAGIRVGFHRHTQEGLYRGDFINRPVPYNPYQHIAEQFVTLAEAIDSTTVPKVKRLVVPSAPARLRPMRPEAGEIEACRVELFRRYPALAGRPLVFLCPGAGLLTIRAWPIAHYVEVARVLIDRGYAVAVIGLPWDRGLADQIGAGAGKACLDLTGYTASVRDLAVLLHLGALLITNDGGTGHFASLTPIPAIVLFGPETPQLYGSLSANAVNLHKPLSCSPCLTAYNHRQSPCDGDNICLKSITPGEVLDTAWRLLGVSTRS